jgi:hypothetical protein
MIRGGFSSGMGCTRRMATPTGESASGAEVFRLLVPATAATPQDCAGIVVDGVRWMVTPYTRLPEAGSAPPFTAISYSWGADTVESSFEGGRTVSSRSLPVLEAVLRTLKPEALWLDAFCLPPHDPERSACLRRLGALYALATQSAAVLSAPCGPVLAHIHDTQSIQESMLRTLEQDAWVTRAWTYQELANCQTFQLLAEGAGVAIPAEQFLDALGHALLQLKKEDRTRGGIRVRGLRNVESLEEVLADWCYRPLQKSGDISNI